MEINRETAMRLWTSRYGKKIKVVDFANRVMVKSAYDDRKSEYGRNLDHIFPRSKGGKTADYNLVCCHILTNDEKADKTSFVANGQKFNVVKVGNHYEIHNLTNTDANKENEATLYDSAYGIRRYKKLVKESKNKRFNAEIFIHLRLLNSLALLDFISEVFDKENISIINKDSSNILGLNYRDGKSSFMVVIRSYNIKTKDSLQDLLDKCVLLNTYLKKYFIKLDVLYGYEIVFKANTSTSISDYSTISNDEIDEIIRKFYEPSNSIWIDGMVEENTKAEQDLIRDREDGEEIKTIQLNFELYSEYDYVLTNLSKNLDKEVSKLK